MAASNRKTLIINRDALNLSTTKGPRTAMDDELNGVSKLSAVPFDQSSIYPVSVSVSTPSAKRKREEMMLTATVGTPSFLRAPSTDDLEEELEYHERVLARYRKGTLQHYRLLGNSKSGIDSTLLLTNTPAGKKKGKSSGELRRSILLSTGDVLVVSTNSDGVESLIFYKNCVHAARHGNVSESDAVVSATLSPSPLKSNEVNFFDILTNNLQGSNSDEMILMVSAANSTLYLWNCKSNEVIKHTLQLQEEDEYIRSVEVTGYRVMISTSTGDIHILERFVDEPYSYQLQRSRGVVAGLLTAGAKLLGLSSGRGNNVSYAKMIPFPKESQLFCVGGTLTLWSNYLQSGEEVWWYDFPLGSTLRSDIQHALQKCGTVGVDQLRCLVLDATVMEIDRTSGATPMATLLVLSATASESELAARFAGDASLVRSELWMHTLEVPVERNGKLYALDGSTLSYGQTLKEEDVNVLFRMHLARDVLIDCHHLHDKNGKDSVNPKMFGMPPSWRVFISWTDAVSKHVMCSQIDALNQSIPSTFSGDHNDYIIHYDSVMDTKIHVENVATVNAIVGLDGVFALESEMDELIFICPRLPAKFITAATSISGKRLEGLDLHEAKPKLLQLLLSVVADRNNLTSVVGELRNTFIAWPVGDVAQVIKDVSNRIVNQTPAGRIWGTASESYDDRIDSNQKDVFQLAHHLVAEKVEQHSKLMNIILEADGLRFDEIKTFLFENHQKLCLCAGFSEALQESLMSIEVINAMDGQHDIQQEGYRSAVATITKCVELALAQFRNISHRELESKGLSAFDQFYADVSGIYDTLEYVCRLVPDVQEAWHRQELDGKKESGARTAFCVLSIIFAGIKRALVAGGDAAGKYSVVFQPQVRKALSSLIDNLRIWLERSPENVLENGFTPEVEEKKLFEIIDVYLGGYVDEVKLGQVNSSTVSDVDTIENAQNAQSDEWKEEFLYAKWSITMLTVLDFSESAFALSEKYLHFNGLFEVYKRNSLDYHSRIAAVLESKGELRSSAKIPFAASFFIFLESQECYAEILKLGPHSERLFYDFLKTRPQLAWMHHISRKDYDHAMVTASTYADELMSRSEATGEAVPKIAKPLLNIAKLSSMVHKMKAAKTFADASINDSVPSSSGAKSLVLGPVPKATLEKAEEDIEMKLAFMQVEDSIMRELPKETADKFVNLHPHEMVQIITKNIEAQRDKYGLELESIISLAGKCLAVIDMILKLQENGRYSGPSVQGLLTEFWKAVILLDESNWLSIAMQKSPEQKALEIRKGVALYHLVVSCLEDAQAGGLNQSWLIASLSAERNAQYVKETGLMRKKIDADGHLKEMGPKAQDNTSVLRAVQEAISLAFKEADVC